MISFCFTSMLGYNWIIENSLYFYSLKSQNISEMFEMNISPGVSMISDHHTAAGKIQCSGTFSEKKNHNSLFLCWKLGHKIDMIVRWLQRSMEAEESTEFSVSMF